MNCFLKNLILTNSNNRLWKNTFPIGDDPTMKTYSIDNIVTTKNIRIKNVNYEKTDLFNHIAIYADFILK